MSGKPYPTGPPMNYPGQSSYPTAQYPQPQYPTAYPYQQQQQYGQPAGMYGGPPPYTSQPYDPPPPYTQIPWTSLGRYLEGLTRTYPAQMPYNQPTMPMYPQQQPQSVMIPGLYDASARFDGIAQPRIPPPPPGTMPNAAQMAAMQGHTVIGTQQRANWFTGSSSGSRGDWGL